MPGVGYCMAITTGTIEQLNALTSYSTALTEKQLTTMASTRACYKVHKEHTQTKQDVSSVLVKVQLELT